MKLIDFYIIKRYIGTFSVMLLLFIPIGIMVDLAEKIDKLKEKEVPLESILEYYIDFTWYFANLLFPIFLFLSVIWFTSKLADNTEVIAILSSGISFFRYLRPFLLGASFIAVFAFFAVYFFIMAKRNKTQSQAIKEVNLSKKNSFFKGVLLAALNLLTIPYYSGLNAMWNEAGWIKFEAKDITTFVVAAGVGTFSVLYLYTFYFDKMETKTNRFSKNSNYILSALMLLLLIITLIRIMYR